MRSVSPRWPKDWTHPLPSRSSATDKPPSPPGSLALANMHRSCTNASSPIFGSRIFSWMNCELGSGATSRWCGFGSPSIPAPRSFPCFNWVPARNTWRTCSSTRYDSTWPPFCLPLFTSDGLNLYFYALTAHFGHWLQVSRQGRKVLRWQVAAELIYGQVKRRTHRRWTAREVLSYPLPPISA
jgi:hypothetical protein